MYPNYDTSNLLRERNPQKVQRFVIDEDYFVYDSAIINLTEKQLVDRIGERVARVEETVFRCLSDSNGREYAPRICKRCCSQASSV